MIEGKNDIEFLLYEVENVAVIGNSSDDKITVGEGDEVTDADWGGDANYHGFINLNDDDDADVWDDRDAL